MSCLDLIMCGPKSNVSSAQCITSSWPALSGSNYRLSSVSMCVCQCAYAPVTIFRKFFWPICVPSGWGRGKVKRVYKCVCVERDLCVCILCLCVLMFWEVFSAYINLPPFFLFCSSSFADCLSSTSYRSTKTSCHRLFAFFALSKVIMSQQHIRYRCSHLCF